MSFSVSRASTTKHSLAGELLQVHPRGKSIKSRLTSVIRRRTTSGAGDEDTGASHISSLLDDVQEFEQELERYVRGNDRWTWIRGDSKDSQKRCCCVWGDISAGGQTDRSD